MPALSQDATAVFPALELSKANKVDEFLSTVTKYFLFSQPTKPEIGGRRLFQIDGSGCQLGTKIRT